MKKFTSKRLISNMTMKIWTPKLLILKKTFMNLKVYSLNFWNNLKFLS